MRAAEEQSLNDAATAFGLPPDSVTQALEEILLDTAPELIMVNHRSVSDISEYP